jgi:peptide/nickel transport system substrate-binding protein
MMASINHQQAQEFLHMRQRDLSEADQQALQAHLAGCAECREYTASLELLQDRLRKTFHTHWDTTHQLKSRTGSLLMRLGREITRIRISTFAGTLAGVIALVALVLGLNYAINNLRPQPATVPMLPTGTTTSQLTLLPATIVITPSDTLVPSPTPLPEGTIVLNWSYAILPPDSNTDAIGENWAKELSTATGLNIIALPGPTTDLEILEALRDGKIHMAKIDPLAFVYGQAQGWVSPGPIDTYTYQPTGSIMFVARKDSGLLPGDPPEVFQQLAGKHPCWPDPEGSYQNTIPVREYFLPAGLLSQQGIELGSPVFTQHTAMGHFEFEAVFLKECDFAVKAAEPAEDFLKYMYDFLMNRGVSFTDWKEQMQVLYTSPPLQPDPIMAFSNQLNPAQRQNLADAILQVPAWQGNHKWVPFDDNQAQVYLQFQNLIDASGVDVTRYLNRVWDLWLRDVVAASLTPSPTPEPTNPPSSRTLTICMGAEPNTLDINGSGMLAKSNILEAIYDGPIDSTGFSYQPIILKKLPNLIDGDASIQPVSVKQNDLVVNSAGEVVLLQPGELVHPYGCYLSDCAITWQGEPLEMAQLSATFTLKPNIRWSDGEPLTSDDSVFGFEQSRNCQLPGDPTSVCGTLGAGGHQTAESTASYTALDDLTTQWVGLPGYLDQAYMTNFAHPLPRHLLQSLGQDAFLDMEAHKPLGWGPYQIDKWQPGEYIRLSKNPNYFRASEGLPHFDQLVFRFFGQDEDATYTALQNGYCDLVDYEQGIKNLSLQSLLENAASGQVQALISTGTTWEHLDFNIRPAESILNTGAFASWDLDGDGQGPFGDVRLRQAIAMCLDRPQVIDTIFLGQSLVPDTYLPPDHPLINSEAVHWQYDPAAAQALLDGIGWIDDDNDPATPRVANSVTGVPNGTPLAFSLATTDAAIRQEYTQILAQSLQGCGMGVTLKYYTASEWLADAPEGPLFGRQFDLGIFAWLTGVKPPCDLYLSSQIPSAENGWAGQNDTGYSNPDFDSACNLQLQSLPGQESYLTGAEQAQLIFSQDLPVVPLFLTLKYAAARPDMCGYSLDPTSQSDFWNIEAFNYGAGCK